MDNFGILSLAPAALALILAFITKDALLSILIGIIVGVVISGQNVLFGFSSVLQEGLGNADFIWVLSIEVFIGIMVAYFQKSGAIQAFSNLVGKKKLSARGASSLAYALGMFIFFSDYFSPLYVGNVMRPLTDKARVSREKLSYICDSTASPICCLIPFTSWSVYMSGLIIGVGSITSVQTAQNVIIHAAPYNFYCIAALVICGLVSFRFIPDFGPMRKAEKRAMEEGKVVADGSTPLLSKEFDSIKPNEGIKPNLFINFFAPAIIIIVVILGTYIVIDSAKVLEAMVLAVVYQFVVMLIQKMATVRELMKTAVDGIKGVMDAILILAMAYCLNAISKTLGTANFVVSIAEDWMTPALLVVLTFVICAVVSFFTGTAWGTYAIMTPITLPLAFSVSGGVLGPVVYASIAAIMGGGCFGDHCSPLSDTTILASLAAGSDHVDHVKTQLVYAMLAAVIAAAGYLIVGVIL